MKLTILTCTHNSEATIKQFIAEAHAAALSLANQVPYDLEYNILVIDDHSEDGTVDNLRTLGSHDRNLQVIRLSRRVGQHAATLEGLAQSDGDFIFLLDSDLEENPIWLMEFWGVMTEMGVDSVHGQFESRHGTIVRRLGSKLFWAGLTFLGAIELPRNATMARLLTRRFVDAALVNRRASGLLAVIFSLAGPSVAVRVDKSFKGWSSYSVWQKSSIAIQHIIIESRQLWWRLTFFMMMTSVVLVIATATSVLVGLSLLVVVSMASGAMAALLLSAIFAVGLMIRSLIENQLDRRPAMLTIV